jgi:hypothetical protein
MPKFKNREEYEQWKAEKLAQAQNAPGTSMEMTSGVPEDKESKKGTFIILTVLIVIALSGFFIYKQFSQDNVDWTEFSYTNRTLGFSVNIPEGWSQYEFPPEIKAAIKAGTVPGTKTLFTLSPNNSKDAVYGIMDMQKVIQPDNPNVGARINGELKTAEALFKGQGFRVSRFKKTISGLTASFMKAKRYKSVFITGVVLKAPENIIMFQFFNSDGKYEREFWKSAETLEFI